MHVKYIPLMAGTYRREVRGRTEERRRERERERKKKTANDSSHKS